MPTYKRKIKISEEVRNEIIKINNNYDYELVDNDNEFYVVVPNALINETLKIFMLFDYNQNQKINFAFEEILPDEPFDVYLERIINRL